jgi:hypothetical protein
MAVRMSAPRTGRILLPRNIIIFFFWYSFVLEAELTLGPSAAEGLGKLEEGKKEEEEK